MSILKKQAINILDDVRREGRINYDEYSVLFDAIDEVETIKERDKELKELWYNLEDVPYNSDTECIEADFGIWKAGTEREEIWHWFDERYSKGVYALLYGLQNE